jgi:hypothetical protein
MSEHEASTILTLDRRPEIQCLNNLDRFALACIGG